MQSTHKISGDAASGFAAYLTDSRGRGDYYVGGEADGEMGRWQGSADALGRLGLQPGEPVERDALLALMNARSPVSGDAIRPVGGDGSRVAGIDMTFSAPKSVSALWAVSSPYRRAQIEAAHRGAIASAMSRVERDVELVRRRGAHRDGDLGQVRGHREQDQPAQGLTQVQPVGQDVGVVRQRDTGYPDERGAADEDQQFSPQRQRGQQIHPAILRLPGSSLGR